MNPDRESRESRGAGVPVWILPGEAESGPPLPAGARDAVERINRKVAARSSLGEVLDFVYDSTRGLYPCDRLGLALVEDDGRRIAARWARAEYAPLRLTVGYAEPVRGGSFETVLRTGKVRILPDLEAYLRDHPRSASTRLIVEEGARSSMTCPLRVEDRPVGLLFRSSRSAGAYRPEHARLHQLIAERLGQAVENALRLDRLAEANRAASEMLGFVSHEVKNSLNHMLLESEILLQGIKGPLNDGQRERVVRIRGHVDRMTGMVRDYLDVARIGGDSFRPRIRDDVDFAAVVLEPAIRALETDIAARGMRVERRIPAGLRVRCDPDLVSIAVANLLGNAVKYGRPGGRLEAAASGDDAGWSFRVRNDGAGFTPEQKPRLFRRFSRLKDGSARGLPGTGLGLYAVWRIADRHGGSVFAESDPGRWAEFGFRLPAAVPGGVAAPRG